MVFPLTPNQIGFNFPLFTSGRIHAEIARADLEQKRVDQDHQLLEERIVREVKSAIDELNAAHKNVEVANRIDSLRFAKCMRINKTLILPSSQLNLTIRILIVR
jgi:hypothetical protein